MFCIRASTTPTTWMDDTDAASSWAWSLGQKRSESESSFSKVLVTPILWPCAGHWEHRINHVESLFSKAHRPL